MICSSQRNQDDSYVLARLFLSRLVRESRVGVRLFFPLSFAACLAFACLCVPLGGRRDCYMASESGFPQSDHSR